MKVLETLFRRKERERARDRERESVCVCETFDIKLCKEAARGGVRNVIKMGSPTS